MNKLTYAEVGITEPEEGIIEFLLTPDIVKVVRKLRVLYIHQDPFFRETDAETLESILERDISDAEAALLHKQAIVALQIILVTGKFKAGSFRAKKYSQDWHEYKPKKAKLDESGEDMQTVPETSDLSDET